MKKVTVFLICSFLLFAAGCSNQQQSTLFSNFLKMNAENQQKYREDQQRNLDRQSTLLHTFPGTLSGQINPALEVRIVE